MKKKGIQVAFAITLVIISITATFWKSELLGNIIYAVVIPSFLLSIISFIAEIAERCESNAKEGSTLAEENADLADNLAEKLAEDYEKESFYCSYAAEQRLKEIEEQFKKSIEQYKVACAYKDVRIFFLRCKSVCQTVSIVGYVLLFLSLILSPYVVKLLSVLDLNCITLWSLTILYFTLELKSEICAKIFDVLYKKGLKKINKKKKTGRKRMASKVLESQKGRQANQKMKPYLVFQYLMRQSDENHVVHAHEIVSYLEEDCGITAERRSIYRDIEEINKALLILDEGCTMQDAEEMLAEDQYGALKTIVYDKSRNGFYVRQRQYDLDDLRLMAECVYTSKFIPKKEADRLVEVLCGFASDHQQRQLRHSADVVGRVRISNDAVLRNIPLITDAMSKELDGEKHIPEQISFKYVSFNVSNVRNQVERRHGERITVSPFHLLINDGFYYLLAYNSVRKKLLTYRVDRMRDVKLAGIPREGAEAFAEIDLSTLTKQRFSMMQGRESLVTIRFVNHLIDTVVDRLGTEGVQYVQINENHFTVTAKLEVGSMFYGWLLGFGKGAKLLAPDAEVEKFRDYIQNIREMY